MNNKINIFDIPHYIVVGDNASFIEPIARMLVKKCIFSENPKKLGLFLAAGSNDSWLYELKGKKNLLFSITSNHKQLFRELKFIRQEMSRRMNLFIKEGVKDIDGYNKKFQNSGIIKQRKKLPYILIVIDRVEIFEQKLVLDFLDCIKEITGVARFLGMHCIFIEKQQKEDDSYLLNQEVRNCFPKQGIIDLRINNDLYSKALSEVLQKREVSASWLQRKLEISYSKAAVIVARMEYEGIVGPQIGTEPRKLLVEHIG